VWTGGKTGKYAGHFVYADAENLYEGKGGVVEVTDLYDIRDAKAVQNFNEGNYQYTDITVKVGKQKKYVQVKDEERGRRMAVFLNALAYMRDGGEDGRDKDLQKLSPEAMGAVAKEVAKTGEFPRRLRDFDDGDVRVPKPRKDGRRSTGLLAMLVTVVVAGLLFAGFRAINPPLRDRAVFDKIKGLPAKDQPYALRLYINEQKFTAHRDEAQKLLQGHYEKAVNSHVNGGDPDLKRGLSDVVLTLPKKPQPVASLVTVEEQAPAGQEVASANREKTVQTQLADKWGSTIGDELVVFAAPSDPNNPAVMDRKAKGMIDLRWRFQPDGTLEYTIEFRPSPEEAPIVKKTATVPPVMAGDPLQQADRTAQALADHILQMTVGGTRLRPPPPPADF
jgi:hypothetical protein